MSNSTVKVSIRSVAFYPVISEDENITDTTYVTYLLNSKWGDIQIPKHTEDAQEIIEFILEQEKNIIKNELIGDYEVEI